MGSPKRTTIFPELPKPGDTIGIIAPASSFDRQQFEKGCEHLRRLGYKTFFHESIFERELYFAGSAERRAWELHQMFEKRFVKAILCARGGYGSNYILPHLQLDLIRANPKFLMGYSDVTSLLTYIHDESGLVTYHGPMVAKDLADAESDIDFVSPLNARLSGLQLRSGRCAGRLYGGCLSMLVESLGTPYEVDANDAVLFLEDVGTKPYQIDRMLMHLKLAGKLERVRGIIFGEMVDCVQPGKQDYTLQQVVANALTGFAGPIAWGVRSGHLADYRVPGVTLPVGAQVELEVSENEMSVRQISAGVLNAS